MKINLERHEVSVILLFLLLSRILFLGASIGDALAILALAGFSAYSLYTASKYKETQEEVLNRFKSLDDHYKNISIQLEELDKVRKETMDLRQQLGILKIDKAYNNIQASSINSYATMANKMKEGTSEQKAKRFF
jgi:hypothetical protein